MIRPRYVHYVPPRKARRPGAGKPRAVRRVDTSIEDGLGFQARAVGLPAPERQFQFATELGRRFRADYAWPEYRVIVEVQGGIWRRGGGAHSRPSRILDDVEKAQFAALLGWFVVPVTTDEVKNGKAVALIERVLTAHGWLR